VENHRRFQSQGFNDGRKWPASPIPQPAWHFSRHPYVRNAIAQKRSIARAAELSEQWAQQSPAQIRGILRTFVTRIDLRPDKVEIHLLPERIDAILIGDASALSWAPLAAEDAPTLTLSAPARLRRAGKETKMLIEGRHAPKGQPDPSLIKLIVKAQKLKEQFIGGGDSLGSIAKSVGVSRPYFTRLVKLAFLAPDITKAILEGCHPSDLTASRLINQTRLPLDWKDQRTALTFI